MKTKFDCWWITFKLKAAPILQKGGDKNKNAIKNYRKIIY
jgi:hypothetical protein